MVTRSNNRQRWWALTALVALVATLAPAGTSAQAAPDRVVRVAASAAAPDPFFTYTGRKPLKDYKPGTVLKKRSLTYSFAGLPTPLNVVQIVFRSTNQRGLPTAAVTSVFKSPTGGTTNKVLSYQSFYDSLNPEDGPSRAIAGGQSIGGMIAHAETLLVLPFLLQGYAVVTSDTEGPTANFAAGPEYGMVTLDSLRAALRTPSTGIGKNPRIGLIGYSGGAIATGWAAVRAPTYAPGINRRIVGAAEGGVLVRPATNLGYVDGSLVWSGIAPMAIVGLARAFKVDLRPFLSARGLEIYKKMQKDSIVNVLGAYPGLTFKELVKPRYADPTKIPIFVKLVNQLNLGTRPSPTVPMFMGQGTIGDLEGTLGKQPGDGVMVAGDVRTLARKYCVAGVRVTHKEYPLSHVTAVPLWVADAVPWLMARVDGTPAPKPNKCSDIPRGNPLRPLKATR